MESRENTPPNMAEWGLEASLANPSLVGSSIQVGLPSLIYLLLSWLIQDFTSGIVSVLVRSLIVVQLSILLIQSLPSDLFTESLIKENKSRYRIFNVVLWIARILFITAVYVIELVVFEANENVRWFHYPVVSFIFLPLIWFALLQIRQFGFQIVLNVLSPKAMPLVVFITLIQASLWAACCTQVLTGPSIGYGLIFIVLVAFFHLVGNLLIAVIASKARYFSE